MLLVDRTWQSTTTYKYGFNGQEQDNEIYGNGNLNCAMFWEFDTRLGRRWNIDPLVKYWESGYSTLNNNPIFFIDPFGAVAGDFYDYEGNWLGSDGINDDKVYVTTEETITNYSDKSSKVVDWDLVKINSFNLTSSYGITHTQFKELAGTLYSEDASSYDAQLAIFNVMENRAKARSDFENKTVSVYDVATAGDVYGWSDWNQINNVNADKQKVQNSFKAVITGLTTTLDLSNGAFYWHGADFAKPVEYSRAYENFYLAGFDFTNTMHDLWGLGDYVNSGNRMVIISGFKFIATWNYKYESTAAYGQTTFMILTGAWKAAQYNDLSYSKHKPY